jgi:hypothetical protein
VYLVPIVAWIVALVLGAVVLTFCGYEVWWKARRLGRDLERLQALDERVTRLQADAAALQARARDAARTAAATAG